MSQRPKDQNYRDFRLRTLVGEGLVKVSVEGPAGGLVRVFDGYSELEVRQMARDFIDRKLGKA